jgi:zinc transporter ZupT
MGSYFVLAYYGMDSAKSEEQNNRLMFWVGILLLISAGSFLYVALLHILPEVLNDNDNHNHYHEEPKSEVDMYSSP